MFEKVLKSILFSAFIASDGFAENANQTQISHFSCKASELNTLSKKGYLLPKLVFPTSWDFSTTTSLWSKTQATEIEKIIAYHIAIFGAEDEASKLLLSGLPIKPLRQNITLKGAYLSKANNEKVEGLFSVSPQNGPEVFLSEQILADSFLAITKLRHELWHYLLDKTEKSDSSTSWYSSELREATREVETILTLRRFYLDNFGVTDKSKDALDLLDYHTLAAMLRQSNYQLHLDITLLAEQLNSTDQAFAKDSIAYFQSFLNSNKLSPSPEEHVALRSQLQTLLARLKNENTLASFSKLTSIAAKSLADSNQAIRRLVSFHNNVLYWQGEQAPVITKELNL
jgi:hypothetical protein